MSTLAIPVSRNARRPNTTVRTPMTNKDAVLFADWLRGDIQAFEALFADHNPRLTAFAHKMTRDWAAAEDIAQRAWEKLIELRNSGMAVESPVGLLLRTTRNLSIDHLRRQKFSTSLDEAPEVAQSGEQNDREWVVLECLDELKEQTREILVLHYYSGYSFDEIAAMMNMKPNAVYTRVSRARAELKERIEQRLAALERIGARK